MTTYFTQLSIEQLHISQLRPEGPIPQASTIDVDRARLYGLSILSSIKVRPIGNKQYELLQGLIAWRAAQYLRIDSIYTQVLDINDGLAREMIADDFAPCLKKKNPIHEAKAIKELSLAESISPSQVGHRLKINRHTVSNLMHILKLPKNIQDHIESGRLPMGKAKMLLTLSADSQIEISEKALKENWSTRQMEDEIRHLKHGRHSDPGHSPSPVAQNSSNTSKSKDAETIKEEERLSENVGSVVEINYDPSTGSGQITINYSSLDVYEGIAQRLAQPPQPTPNFEDDWSI